MVMFTCDNERNVSEGRIEPILNDTFTSAGYNLRQWCTPDKQFTGATAASDYRGWEELLCKRLTINSSKLGHVHIKRKELPFLSLLYINILQYDQIFSTLNSICLGNWLLRSSLIKRVIELLLKLIYQLYVSRIVRTSIIWVSYKLIKLYFSSTSSSIKNSKQGIWNIIT